MSINIEPLAFFKGESVLVLSCVSLFIKSFFTFSSFTLLSFFFKSLYLLDERISIFDVKNNLISAFGNITVAASLPSITTL